MIVWKDVIDWEGGYQITNAGQIRSVPRIIIRSNGRTHTIRGCVLRQNLNSNGYPSVTLQNQQRRISSPVYILVASTFLGPTPAGLEILHGPGGKRDSSVNNLSFGTHQQNSLDMLRDGLGSCKQVIIDGQLFRSINEGARHLDIDASNLSKSLHKGYKCRGKKVQFVE